MFQGRGWQAEGLGGALGAGDASHRKSFEMC